jgi:hypothetical protein
MLSRRAGMPLLPTGTEISAAQTDASGKQGSQDLQRGGTEEAEELKRIAIIAKIAKIEKLIRNGFYNYADFGNYGNLAMPSFASVRVIRGCIA